MEIKLSDKRYEEIKNIVVDLFAKYDITSIPINVFMLAEKMNIKVVQYSEIPEQERPLLFKKSEDGFSGKNGIGEWHIFYNEKKDDGRIRNTIMHEIGHIVLDHSEESELAEKEVKFFAKYALVPPVLLHKLQLDNISEIARVFGVSREAASNALDYYKKWLQCGNRFYTDYEEKLLHLFGMD